MSTVADFIDDEGRDGLRAAACAECGTACGDGQRYCMECGSRRGALPAAVLARIDAMQASKSLEMAVAKGSFPDLDLEEDEDADDSELIKRYMPTPRAAAVAVLGLLAFGVIVGAATSPYAQSAGVTSVLLESPAPAPVESAPEEEEAASPEAAPAEEPAAAAAAAPYPEAGGEEPEAEEPVQAPPGPPPLPPEWAPPPVKHVFMIVLGDHGYEEGFGATSTAPYLAKNLRAQGELLTNYYAVAQGDLANEIALISGQGPTPETTANCPNYADVTPATVSLEEEQIEGNGCVYPATTQTLPGQFAAQALSWKAYIEGVGNSSTEQPPSCRRPTLGTPDPNQLPLPGDAYETWRNPFVYFHALVDGAECAESDVGLGRLGADLKKPENTPTFSYIVPNACRDGSELPCEPGQPAGLAATEAFLRAVVPQIKASDAYKEGGLIAITFAQAPQAGPSADPSSCCATPEYPNLPPVAPAPETTTTEPATPVAGSVKPTGGGGRVGLLLISPFVKKGSLNETDYNHFSLLASIEALFGLEPIGYAANPAMTIFDETVYNAEAESESSTSKARRGLLSLLG
jgi:hypothetical protein